MYIPPFFNSFNCITIHVKEILEMPFLTHNRNGNKIIPIQLTTPEMYKVTRKVRTPLERDRIIGLDTESAKYAGELKTNFLQLYSQQWNKVFYNENQPTLYLLFTELLQRYGVAYERESRIKQRAKHAKTNSKGSTRDGRRQTIKPLVLAFFNMDYDLGRLIDLEPAFRRNISFGRDSIVFPFHDMNVEIVYSAIGVACPSFQWIISKPATKQVIRIVGFDSTSYFKSSLKQVAHDLGTTEKIDLEGEKELFQRDWFYNPPTTQQISFFQQYAINDAQVHYEVYNAIVELLVQIDESIIDSNGCIPASAPACAARIMQHMSSKDEYAAPPVWVQQMGLDAYKGAISFAVKVGYFANLNVIDISSAYPHIMSLLPDMCTVEYIRVKPTKGLISIEKILKQAYGHFGTLVISGISLDAIYPPIVTYRDGKQRGVYGAFNHIACTIPEIEIGIRSGRLQVTEIYEGCIMIGDNTTSNLRQFVLQMYSKKEANKKGTPMYLMSKLLMNSLYGKLIEKRHLTSLIPFVTTDGTVCIVPDIDDEKVRKEAEKIYTEISIEDCILFLQDYAHMHKMHCDTVRLSDYLGVDSWDTGHYFHSIYAANITGFTRAKLMAGARYLEAVSGDTDSLFATKDATGLSDYLNSIGAITPENGLGSFDVEVANASGIIVKKKMYYLEKMKDGKMQMIKQGHHTIQGLSLSKEKDKEKLKEILINLHEKGKIDYSTNEKPIRLKDGLRYGKTLGLFVAHDVTVTLEEDKYRFKDDNGFYNWKEVKNWPVIEQK